MNILNMLSGEKDTMRAAPTPDRLKKNIRVMILTADNTQDLEFFYPYYRLNEEGYDVDVVTPKGGAFTAKNGMGLKESKAIDEARVADYALLYIPGGKAPAEMRKYPEVVNFVRDFMASGKPIAAICHGPQLLVAAGGINGRRMAAWPEVQKELDDAGAIFVDEALVEDGQFITARQPGDLPRHLCGVMDYLKGNKITRRSA